MYEDWIQAKEAKIQARVEATAAEQRAWNEKLSGVAPPPPVEEIPEVEVAENNGEETGASEEE